MSVMVSVSVARAGDWRSGAHFSVPAWQSAHMNILRYRLSLRSLYSMNVPRDSIFAHRVGLSKEWQMNVSVAFFPAVTSAPSCAIDFPVTSAPFTFVSWCPRASPWTSAMLLLRTDAIKNSPFAGSIVSSAPSGLCGRWISTVFDGATLARRAGLCVAIVQSLAPLFLVTFWNTNIYEYLSTVLSSTLDSSRVHSYTRVHSVQLTVL